VHPGLKNDYENIDRNVTQGKATPASSDMQYIMKAQNLTGLADKFNDIKEGVYQSHKKEPLG